ncbi:hypothetical protein [Streptomyces sp. NPDC055992]|uniref:hypothetical protein n=1 Tax=Streptomyces sp. NPDC055992 TaxID=3345673 RepID=UPI0035E24BCF
MAVALRGDRESQHPSLKGEVRGPRPWRLSFGAAEDRNEHIKDGIKAVGEWRSPSGAAEDRNIWASVVAAST